MQMTLAAVSARATSSSKNSKRLWTKAENGGWRCKSRASTCSVALKIGEAFVARERRSAVHTHVHANTPISEELIIVLNMPTLWANVLRPFSQAPAHGRPLHNGETSSRALLTPTSGSALLGKKKKKMVSFRLFTVSTHALLKSCKTQSVVSSS